MISTAKFIPPPFLINSVGRSCSQMNSQSSVLNSIKIGCSPNLGRLDQIKRYSSLLMMNASSYNSKFHIYCKLSGNDKVVFDAVDMNLSEEEKNEAEKKVAMLKLCKSATEVSNHILTWACFIAFLCDVIGFRSDCFKLGYVKLALVRETWKFERLCPGTIALAVDMNDAVIINVDSSGDAVEMNVGEEEKKEAENKAAMLKLYKSAKVVISHILIWAFFFKFLLEFFGFVDDCFKLGSVKLALVAYMSWK